jgi:hypothetical protein
MCDRTPVQRRRLELHGPGPRVEAGHQRGLGAVPSGPARGGYAPVAFPTVNRVLYGAFVWARGALSSPRRRVPAWASMAMISSVGFVG